MEEYKSLNTLKGVACITVILLHCSFPGFLGRFIGYFMRFPVPVFFMISGYFASNRSKPVSYTHLDVYKRQVTNYISNWLM